MPASRVTVTTWAVVDTEGNPIRRRVVAQLHAGEGSATVDGLLIAQRSEAMTDPDTGLATFQLYANDDLDQANTWYSFTVDNVDPAVTRKYEIPTGATADLAELDQVEPAGTFGFFPAPTAGTSGQYLRTDGSTAAWDTIGIGDVDTLTASLTTLAGAISDGDDAVQANVDEIDAIVGPGPLPAVGLFAGLSRLTGQVPQAEGILDRWIFVAAVEDAANINLSTYTAGPVVTQPTFAHGSLSGISSLQRPYAYVLLTAQSTTSQNRIYKVDKTTGQWSQPADTDVFWPPGNGFRATLNAPGDDDHGSTWIWTFDDKTVAQRGGNYADLALATTTGRWTLNIDPTASGGGLSDGSVTTAKLADEAVTAAKLADDLAALIPTRIVPSGNTSVTSSTTLTNVSGLSFAVVNGRTYDFDGIVFCSGDSGGDGKIGVTFPSGTMRCGVGGLLTSTSSLPGSGGTGEVIDASGESVRVGLVTGSTTPSVIGGTFVCTADGTVQFQWAQNASSGTASVLEAAGSRISYTSRPT